MYQRQVKIITFHRYCSQSLPLTPVSHTIILISLMNHGSFPCLLHWFIKQRWYFRRNKFVFMRILDGCYALQQTKRPLLLTGIINKTNVGIGGWTYYQIRKFAGCACAGNAGNVFLTTDFKRKPLISDSGMHHGRCITHVPWCMSRSLTRGAGENNPDIPGACATHNFAYLVGGPWGSTYIHLNQWDVINHLPPVCWFAFLRLVLSDSWLISLI